jgi:hypothetical protein
MLRMRGGLRLLAGLWLIPGQQFLRQPGVIQQFRPSVVLKISLRSPLSLLLLPVALSLFRYVAQSANKLCGPIQGRRFSAPTAEPRSRLLAQVPLQLLHPAVGRQVVNLESDSHRSPQLATHSPICLLPFRRVGRALGRLNLIVPPPNTQRRQLIPHLQVTRAGAVLAARSTQYWDPCFAFWVD